MAQTATTKPSPQARIDGKTADDAWEEWKEKAADHAELVDLWKSAQAARDVRLDDLVKAHDHDIPGAQRADVAKQASDAVAKEKLLLTKKQEAKKALDAARDTVKSFRETKDPEPIFPDDEEDDDEEDDDEDEPKPIAKKPPLSEKRAKETDADFTGKKDGTSDVSKLKAASDARKVSGDPAKKGK